MEEGGDYSCEWLWSKALHAINLDPTIAQAAFSWVAHCDWMAAVDGIARKSPFIMQTMANILNMPIRILETYQACALGSTKNAAIAAGLYPSLNDAMKAMTPDCDRISPPSLTPFPSTKTSTRPTSRPQTWWSSSHAETCRETQKRKRVGISTSRYVAYLYLQSASSLENPFSKSYLDAQEVPDDRH